MLTNELVDCVRCYAPAVEVVTLVVGDRELELDLCADHLEQLCVDRGAKEPGPAERRGGREK